jgi:hypothetical protein
MPRRAVKVVIALSLATVCLVGGTVVGCRVTHPDATTRLARTFDIEDTRGLERQEAIGAIETAIAAKLPLGTSEVAIRDYLVARGVGRRWLSSVHDLDDGSGLLCVFDFDPDSFGIVKASHSVTFRLDAARTLTKITATTSYTGL